MSFYIELDERSLKFGGLKSIAQDWGYLGQSLGRTYKEPDGNISSPLGMWVIGSAFKTNYALTILRMQNHWTEEELILLAGDHSVKICVATDKRFYLYRNYARVFNNYNEGHYRWQIDCTDDQVAAAIAGCGTPKHWDTSETNYF